jgi:hypothetical protein
LKDFLEYRGQTDIYGSRDAIRKVFQLNLIDDGKSWMARGLEDLFFAMKYLSLQGEK